MDYAVAEILAAGCDTALGCGMMLGRAAVRDPVGCEVLLRMKAETNAANEVGE